MRRTILFGFVLLCLAVVSLLPASPVERKILNPDGTIAAAAPAKPTQVEVTNFPPNQTVNGTVNVGNLPAVQNVAGTVAVSNLPVDTEGNVRVAGVVTLTSNAIHFIGFTSASIEGAYYVLALNRACNSELPGTRVCKLSEIQDSIPPPPTWSGYVYIASPAISDSAATLSSLGCLSCGSFGTYPVACCGF